MSTQKSIFVLYHDTHLWLEPHDELQRAFIKEFNLIFQSEILLPLKSKSDNLIQYTISTSPWLPDHYEIWQFKPDDHYHWALSEFSPITPQIVVLIPYEPSKEHELNDLISTSRSTLVNYFLSFSKFFDYRIIVVILSQTNKSTQAKAELSQSFYANWHVIYVNMSEPTYMESFRNKLVETTP